MPIRILLIDDDSDHVLLVKRILKKADEVYQLDCASDGKEGLDKLSSEDYDLVLCDYRLPGLTALDVIREIRQRGGDLPVIVVTASGSEKIAVSLMKEGAYDYIVKDDSYQDTLPAVIEKSIERYNINKAKERAEETLKRRLKELSFLHATSTIISSSLNLKQMLASVFSKAAEVFEAETGSLMLLDEKGEFLTIKASHGLKKGVVSQTRVKVGEGICGWVAQIGQPLLLKNGVMDARFKPVVGKPEIRHAICSPLRYKDETIGVINLNREASPKPFTRDDLDLLSTIAYETATAIQNINLYNDLRTTISELRQANEEIKQAQDQLIQSEKMASLGQLAASVAHELNNPLAIAAGRAELLLMVGDNNQETIKTLKIIHEQTARASKIVDNLLQFSRQHKQEVEPIDVNPVIEKAASLIEHQMSLENIQICKELKRELPRIMGDSNQLQQVFINLMTNACQAMPEGGKLTISTALYDGSLVIKFADPGRGIPEENLNKLFDPFFTTKESGTGLGLSITHGIIRAHNGTIKVQSQVGQGTTFTIKIPVIKEDSLKEGLK